MKKIYKVLSLATVLSSLSLTMFAQLTASANASATAVIVAPITISKTADFDFGNISVTALAGSVVMTPLGVRSATDVTLISGGTPHAASFNVTGTGNSMYNITFPGSVDLTGSVNGTLTLTTFTTAVASGTVGTLVAGAQTFTAGGTLNIPATTVGGTYTSVPFAVTVTYN